MKIKNLIITSPAALDFELAVTAPICVFHGKHSALALDLMRELIGDYGATSDPDAFDDGHFIVIWLAAVDMLVVARVCPARFYH